jgi:hypothetical protein
MGFSIYNPVSSTITGCLTSWNACSAFTSTTSATPTAWISGSCKLLCVIVIDDFQNMFTNSFSLFIFPVIKQMLIVYNNQNNIAYTQSEKI